MPLTVEEIERQLRNLRLALQEAHREERFQRRRAVDLSRAINGYKHMAYEMGIELK